MSEWQKVKIGDFLIKETQRFLDCDYLKNLEVYGVSNVEGITFTSHKKSVDLSKYIVIKPKYFAYNPYRINVGSIGLTPDDVTGLVSPAYVVFRTDESKLLPELLLSFLKSTDGLFEIKKNARGTVRQALRYEDLCKIEMAIPPIEEQRKILKKKKSFDLKLKDVLEKNSDQNNYITLLRQQILQDAISGKLTADWREKNSNIEPANVLLEKIKAKKEKLIAEKKIKKDKQLPPISVNEVPFEIHPQYLWTRVDDLFFIKKGETGIKNANPGIYPLVVTAEERLTHNTYEIDGEAILIPMVSSTGHGHASLKRIHFQDGKFALGSILSALIPITPEYISAKFYFYFLNNFRNQLIVSRMGGAANVALTQKALRSIIVPVLPIAVQEKAVRLLESANLLEEKIKLDKQNTEMLMQSFLVEAFKN